MPTKPELEAEVERLKAQLTAGQNTDVVTIQAELDRFKLDLQSVASERDVLKGAEQNFLATVQESEKKSLALEATVDDLTTRLQKSDERATTLEEGQKKMEELIRQDEELVKKLADQIELTKGSLRNDHVVLDGKSYDITWRSTVKDMVYEGYHKRNLDENFTALVIQKNGG